MALRARGGVPRGKDTCRRLTSSTQKHEERRMKVWGEGIFYEETWPTQTDFLSPPDVESESSNESGEKKEYRFLAGKVVREL